MFVRKSSIITFFSLPSGAMLGFPFFVSFIRESERLVGNGIQVGLYSPAAYIEVEETCSFYFFVLWFFGELGCYRVFQRALAVSHHFNFHLFPDSSNNSYRRKIAESNP